MYPLLLKPVIKNYIWGGERLVRDFSFASDGPAAEAWMLSCREGNENVILNGEYKGGLLSEVIDCDKNSFPLLVKLIDAADDLSVQVHPGAECAALHEGDSAKTEMWYVLDCDEGAGIILGFDDEAVRKRINRIRKEKNKDISLSDALESAVRDGCVTDILRRVPVRPGDVYLVSPGTVHAIGRGILIAEIQQNSDTTYRVYDYERRDAKGNKRELHIDKALDAVRLAETAPRLTDTVTECDYGTERVVETELFGARIISLDGEMREERRDRFLSLILTSGSACLSWKEDSAMLSKGSSVFIPPHTAFALSGKADVIVSYSPGADQN